MLFYLRFRSQIVALSILAGLCQTVNSYAQNKPCLAELVTSLHQPSVAYGQTGHFVEAEPEQFKAIVEAYRTHGQVKAIQGKISRVTFKDLAVDMNTLSEAELGRLVALGQKHLSELAYFTSGAGLWTRGGGQVKALIPYNLKALLSSAEFDLVSRSVDLLNTSTVAADLAASRENLRVLLKKAMADPRALNPLDLKFATVATQSQKAHTYIPFDIWTSEQTHGPIREYLAEFKAGYQKKKFAPDPGVDQKIKAAIRAYFEQSEAKGETHLFGYQAGFHAFDPVTGQPLLKTPLIGEGAGMAKAYLDRSGRTAQLQQMGKKTWVFENIEVNTDLAIGMGAHTQAKTPVSVIVVPEKPGYKGGSPFLVARNGKTSLELHEMSAIPQELGVGNAYFNSNTIFQSLELSPPQRLGFEDKKAGGVAFVRAKMNAGDITQEVQTSGIGGRIGYEYENFKSYADFGLNGEKLIEAFQNVWKRDLN